MRAGDFKLVYQIANTASSLVLQMDILYIIHTEHLSDFFAQSLKFKQRAGVTLH